MKRIELPSCFSSCTKHSYMPIDRIIVKEMKGNIFYCNKCYDQDDQIGDEKVFLHEVVYAEENSLIHQLPKLMGETKNRIQKILSLKGNNNLAQKKVSTCLKEIRMTVNNCLDQFEAKMMEKAMLIDEAPQVIIKEYLNLSKRIEIRNIILNDNFPDLNSKSDAIKQQLHQMKNNLKQNEKKLLQILEQYNSNQEVLQNDELIKLSIINLNQCLAQKYPNLSVSTLQQQPLCTQTLAPSPECKQLEEKKIIIPPLPNLEVISEECHKFDTLPNDNKSQLSQQQQLQLQYQQQKRKSQSSSQQQSEQQKPSIPVKLVQQQEKQQINLIKKDENSEKKDCIQQKQNQFQGQEMRSSTSLSNNYQKQLLINYIPNYESNSNQSLDPQSARFYTQTQYEHKIRSISGQFSTENNQPSESSTQPNSARQSLGQSKYNQFFQTMKYNNIPSEKNQILHDQTFSEGVSTKQVQTKSNQNSTTIQNGNRQRINSYTSNQSIPGTNKY